MGFISYTILQCIYSVQTRICAIPWIICMHMQVKKCLNFDTVDALVFVTFCYVIPAYD